MRFYIRTQGPRAPRFQSYPRLLREPLREAAVFVLLATAFFAGVFFAAMYSPIERDSGLRRSFEVTRNAGELLLPIPPRPDRSRRQFFACCRRYIVRRK